MKRIQERKLSMYEVVNAYLTETDPAIIAQMPLMDQALATLNDNIETISSFGSSQNLNRKGIMNTKEALRNALTTITLDVSRKVKGYATNTSNMVLFQEVNYTKSSIGKLADNILVIIANIIFEKAKDNIANLTTYNVTSATIIEFRKAIDDYDASIPKPRTGIVLKRNATMSLKQYFTATDSLLKEQMDILVGIIQQAETDFFINYTNSRKIINPGHYPLAIRALVKDTNGIPIPGVTATVQNNSRVYRTKDKGGFYIKSFPQGTYTFTFNKEGYTSQQIPIVVASGERTDVNITLATSAELKVAS